MEPLASSRDGKENDSGAQGPSCRPSPAASPAASDGSGARKRPALSGQPEASPLAVPVCKRRRPGSPPSTSASPADERETSAEATARRQLAALSSPSGRPGSAAAQGGATGSEQARVMLSPACMTACYQPKRPPVPRQYLWTQRRHPLPHFTGAARRQPSSAAASAMCGCPSTTGATAAAGLLVAGTTGAAAEARGARRRPGGASSCCIATPAKALPWMQARGDPAPRICKPTAAFWVTGTVPS